jgi:hypothetical protein
MRSPAPYALFVLNPGANSLAGRLEERVRACLAELGLAQDLLAVLTEDDFDPGEPSQLRRAIAAVYLGDVTRAEGSTALAARFVGEGWPILPIVSSLERFTAEIPEILHPVNGMEPDLDRAANVLLAELGLMRRRRRLFISYLRRESTGVARQLAADLLDRGYEVFLDTISVDKGVLFQPALWGAMVDTDIVVFLDTPNAFASRWVEQEFSRASELGVTLLHLVWPDQPRARAAEFAEPIMLNDGDFAGGVHSADPAATLCPSTVERVAASVERLRAAAWRHRRARLTESLIRQIPYVRECDAQGPATDLTKIDAPTGAIHLTRTHEGHTTSIVVLPLHGLPRSQDWHEVSKTYESAQERRLLFQRGGVEEAQREHIAWLDRHLPTQSLAVEEIEAWLKRH